jgi:hypothetical protein
MSPPQLATSSVMARLLPPSNESFVPATEPYISIYGKRCVPLAALTGAGYILAVINFRTRLAAERQCLQLFAVLAPLLTSSSHFNPAPAAACLASGLRSARCAAPLPQSFRLQPVRPLTV